MDKIYKRRLEYLLKERLPAHKAFSREELKKLRSVLKRIVDMLHENYNLHPLPEYNNDVRKVLCKFYIGNIYATRDSGKETEKILMSWNIIGRKERQLRIQTYTKGKAKNADPERIYNLDEEEKFKNEIFPYLSKKLGSNIGSVINTKQSTNEVDSSSHLSLEMKPCDWEESEKYKTEVTRYIRDTKISKNLKATYDHKCQICGLDMQLQNGKFYIEAHHIKPRGNSHGGPDEEENLIIVCPNDHARLDYGIIPLDPSRFKFSRHSINSEYIEYHNQNIYKGKYIRERI